MCCSKSPLIIIFSKLLDVLVFPCSGLMIITSLSPLLLLVSPLLPPLNITFPLFLSVNPQISHNLPKLNFLLLLVFLLSPFLLMLGSYLTVQSDSASVQSSHAARTEQSNAVAFQHQIQLNPSMLNPQSSLTFQQPAQKPHPQPLIPPLQWPKELSPGSIP